MAVPTPVDRPIGKVIARLTGAVVVSAARVA